MYTRRFSVTETKYGFFKIKLEDYEIKSESFGNFEKLLLYHGSLSYLLCKETRSNTII